MDDLQPEKRLLGAARAATAVARSEAPTAEAEQLDLRGRPDSD